MKSPGLIWGLLTAAGLASIVAGSLVTMQTLDQSDGFPPAGKEVPYVAFVAVPSIVAFVFPLQSVRRDPLNRRLYVGGPPGALTACIGSAAFGMAFYAIAMALATLAFSCGLFILRGTPELWDPRADLLSR